MLRMTAAATAALLIVGGSAQAQQSWWQEPVTAPALSPCELAMSIVREAEADGESLPEEQIRHVENLCREERQAAMPKLGKPMMPLAPSPATEALAEFPPLPPDPSLAYSKEDQILDMLEEMNNELAIMRYEMQALER